LHQTHYDEHYLDLDEHYLDFDDDAYVPTATSHLHRRHSALQQYLQ